MKKWLLRSIGIAIFIVILTQVDLKEVVKSLRQLDIFYAALPVVFTFLFLFFKVFRWRLLLKAQEIDLSWKDAFLIYASGLFWGLATPGRVGELSKLFYLKEEGYSLGKSLPNIILDRVLDISLLFLVAYFGMVYLSHLFRKTIITLTIILGLVVIISLWLFFHKEIRKKIMRKVFNLLIPQRMKDSVRENYQTFFRELKDLDRNRLSGSILMTIPIWLFYFIIMYILVRALGITIPFLYLSICCAISMFVAAIPISLAGIGTRDLVLILLFANIGLNKNQAVSVSFICIYLNFIILITGFLAWHLKPVRIGKAHENTGT